MTVGTRGGIGLGSLLGLGALGAVVLGLWWLVRPGEEALTIDPARVVVVQRGEVLDAVNASGRVEPLARVAVMSRASGIIKELLVEEGDVVTSKQILAQLDREQIEAELVQDRANLTSAKARLAAAKARLDEARVRLDDPEVEFVQRQADRMETLFKSDRVSESDRDDAALALARAQFRVKQVESSLPVLDAAVQEADANLLSAQAALERTETSLRETTIRCPIDGVVLVRDKEVGDGVSSILTAGGNATQLMTLGDLSTMHIEARVDEVDLGRISDGMPARVLVDAYRSVQLDGVVSRIAPAGSVDNNGIVTFEVRVAVEDPTGILRPDMTADAKLILERVDDVLTLPRRAVQTDDDGASWVDVVVGEGEDATLRRIPVTLGLTDGLLVELQGDLREGDRVHLPAPTYGGRG